MWYASMLALSELEVSFLGWCLLCRLFELWLCVILGT
jgi:hypothetical protein